MILHTLASNRLENSHEVLLRGRQDIASFLLLPSFLSWHFWLWKVVEVLQGAVKQLVQLSILGSHLAQVVRGSESNLINLLSLSPQAPSRQVGRLVLSWVPALPRHFCYVGPCRPPCTQNYIRPGCEISSSYTRGAPLPFLVPVVRKMARVTVTQRARPEDRDALFTGAPPPSNNMFSNSFPQKRTLCRVAVERSENCGRKPAATRPQRGWDPPGEAND